MATTLDLTKASALPADAYAIIPKGYQAKVLIRRFTDSLPGDNELEISAKEAQAEIDKTERERHLERLYSNVDDNNNRRVFIYISLIFLAVESNEWLTIPKIQ